MVQPRHLRAARRLHVRLACFFTPLLFFFTITGAAQLFMLHVDDKSGYHAPRVLEVLGNIHVRQHAGPASQVSPVAAPFRFLSLAMCSGLVATMTLGMFLAGASASRELGWRLFLAGSVVPVVALWVGHLSSAAQP